MRKSFKFRIYPNRSQTHALEFQLRECCALYNAALQERGDAWKHSHVSLNYFTQSKQLPGIRSNGNTKIINAQVAQNVLKRVDLAFQAFFHRVKRGEKAGYPRFRSQRRYDSFTFPQYESGVKLLPSGRLRVSGIGEVKIKLHREIGGTIKTVSIKRQAERWFAIFSVECDDHPLLPSAESVGVDVGVNSFAVLSNGEIIENPRFYRNAQAILRIAQRKVSRRRKGSYGRKKAIQILQRVHEHIANQRSDFQHKVSRDLANRFGLIAVEDLSIQNMVQSNLAKSIHDVGWGEFFNKLAYKAEDAGRKFMKVDPKNTTQICSGCGVIVKKTRSEGWHHCSHCGLSLSRDHNASINILGLGRSLVELT